MAVAATGNFTNHLDGDVNKIFFDDYAKIATYYDKVAKVSTAPRGNHYTEAELSDLGALREIPEGNPVSYDDAKEGHKKEITFPVYGLGFQITRQMLDDDLQRNFMKMPSKLAKSAAYKRETEFWDLFNNGFATHQAWDATETSQYVFDTAHATLKSATTIANRPATDAALSETSYEAACEYFAKSIVSEAGHIEPGRPRYLIVPTVLQWTASQLLKSEGPYLSANRNINPVNSSMSEFAPSVQIVSVPWLTSSTAWFMLGDDHDFRFMWKWPIEMESADDFDTGNALYKVLMRFKTAVFDYKHSYGTSGA